MGNKKLLFLTFPLALCLLLSACGAGQTAPTELPSPTPSPSLPAAPTASPATATPAPTPPVIPTFAYEAEPEDLCLELTPSDLKAGGEELFGLADFPWGSTREEVSAALGNVTLPAYPEHDPDVWVQVSAEDYEILFVPYFHFDTATGGLIEIELIADRGEGRLEDLDAKAEALLAELTALYSEPETDIWQDQGRQNGQTITYDNLESTWEGRRETGFNKLVLEVSVYHERCIAVEILLYHSVVG